MVELTDLLQLSEIALPLGRTNPWPEAGIHPINSASGLKLNGQSLEELGTRLVAASTRTELGLANQFVTYSGFKYNGSVVKLPIPGTQPYSTTVADNQLKFIKGPTGVDDDVSVSLWRETNGVLKCNVDGVVSDLGNATAANYVTYARRGLRFILVHLCGCGGGGGRHGGAINGWGGGSGSAAAILVDMLPFTSSTPLMFSIPGGGVPGTWDPDRPNGDDGNPLTINSSAPTASGTILIRSGQGGARSGTAFNGYGMGGGSPDRSAEGTLYTAVSFLATINGSQGGRDDTRWKAGLLPTCSYNDPNPSAISISTYQSFNGQNVGDGGDGGLDENGQWGKPGAISIYY